MAKMTVDWHDEAFLKILRGEEGSLRRELDKRGVAVANRAGRNYQATGWVGRIRYRVTVAPTKPGKRPTPDPLVAALDAAKTP
jgi:hypothetical protein